MFQVVCSAAGTTAWRGIVHQKGRQVLTLLVTILQEQHHLVRPQTIMPEFLEFLRSADVDGDAAESPEDFQLPLVCHHPDADIPISNKVINLWLGCLLVYYHR